MLYSVQCFDTVGWASVRASGPKKLSDEVSCCRCNDSNSKSAGHRCCCRWMGQTDGQTDRRPAVSQTLLFILRGLSDSEAIKAVMLMAVFTPLFSFAFSLRFLPFSVFRRQDQSFSYRISSPSIHPFHLYFVPLSCPFYATKGLSNPRRETARRYKTWLRAP